MAKGVASVCATCRFAEWKKTANGRNHPDGSGRCTFLFPDAPVPKWASEFSWDREKRRLTTVRELLDQKCSNRYIYRVDSHRIVAEACGTFSATD